MSIIGIAIGIATIVALGLITAGMQDSVQTTFNEGGAEITVSNSTTVGGNNGMINLATMNELKNIRGVIDVAGELSYSESSNNPSQGMGPNNGGPNNGGSGMMNSVIGISSDKLSLAGIKNINGSAFKNSAHEAIVGSQYAVMNNLSIGDSISISNTDFKITGTYETGSIFIDGAIYVPLDTLQNLTGTDEVSSVLVKTDEGVNDTVVSDEI